MNKITPAHKTYKQVQDVREEPIRIGKYLYLMILSAVLLMVIHLLFGHLYLLKGDGFVYSDNRSVELEFDATITQLAVKEGDITKPKTTLFNYDSLTFRKQLAALAFEITELQNKKGELQVELLEMTNQISSAEKYAAWSQGLRNDLHQLSKKNLVPKTQLSTESFRSFEAQERLESYQAKKKQIEINIATLDKNIMNLEQSLHEMRVRFNEGIVTAEVDGIINSLQVAEGDVLRKGDNAMRIFYGNRYIYAYFDQRSWVKYKPGDTVFVRIPGRTFVKGKIRELLPVSNRIPEEFQPRFKRTRRDQVAVIEVSPEVLNSIAIMSTVSIVKPFFM